MEFEDKSVLRQLIDGRRFVCGPTLVHKVYEFDEISSKMSSGEA